MKAQAIRNQTQKNGPGADTPEKSIQERAYQFFVDRGCEPGHELEDWLRAEREVKASREKQRV